MGHVDALVITALPEEFEAAKAAADVSWRDGEPQSGAPYLRADLKTPTGWLGIALARTTAMGGRPTAPPVTRLVSALRPTCLAMTGVCAGNPAETALGDVLVAAPAFQYDEGMLRGDEFLGDVQQFPLEDRWLRVVQDYDPSHLPSHGPAGEDDTTRWLLERLLTGQDPRTHPARARYVGRGRWTPLLERTEAAGLVAQRPDGTLALTDAGRELAERTRYRDVDGPDTLPFTVMAGPLASGNKVVQDPDVWERLRRMGSRRILGLDMEAATVATIAHQVEVPHWLVAKGVMDGAELDREDRFRTFAARASAEVLFDLLGRLLTPRPPGAGPTNTTTFPGAVKVDVLRRLIYDWLDLADMIGVPPADRARFGPGEGPRGVWEWLEARGRLAELEDALVAIGRDDIAEVLRRAGR